MEVKNIQALLKMACGELILEGTFSHFNLYNVHNSFVKNQKEYNQIVPSSGHGKDIHRHIIFWPVCAITLNYCTHKNHVGVSPRALHCVVDTSYGLGRSLGHCRPALPKGRKYQMVKTQTQSHVRRPVV